MEDRNARAGGHSHAWQAGRHGRHASSSHATLLPPAFLPILLHCAGVGGSDGDPGGRDASVACAFSAISWHRLCHSPPLSTCQNFAVQCSIVAH